MPPAFLQGLKAPLHVSHRGGALLYPENTLFAFGESVRAHRTDLLELDVHATRDGQVVVAHDGTLDRCTDRAGELAALDWADLRAADAGYRFTPDGGRTFPFRGRGIGIPRFADVLQALPGVRINVELKAPGVLGPFVDLVRRAGVQDRLCMGSEHDDLGAALAAALPQACHFFPRNALAAFVLGFRAGETQDDPRYAVLDMPLDWEGVRLFDRALAEEAARLGKWINVWTVDEPADMRWCLDQGVGGVMTDRPDLLRQVIDAR